MTDPDQTITLLKREIHALRQHVAELERIQQQHSAELRWLRLQYSNQPTNLRQLEVQPLPPRVERSLDYYMEHSVDYGESFSHDQLAAYLARPRVDPAQVVLTEADLARQPPRRKLHAAKRPRPINTKSILLFICLTVLLLVGLRLLFAIS